MRKEVLENILTDNNKVPKHGSGVGVINVHSRIKLMFGEGYGLTVYSEPDEGTKVVIHIPAIPYTKENAEKLEMQKYSQRGNAHEKNKITFFAMELIRSCIGTVFCVEDFYSERAGKKSSVILPESGDQRWDSLIKGMKQSAKENHIHLVICNTDDIENAEAEKEAIEEQKNNHIDAFIVLPAPGTDTKEMLTKECSDVPVILVVEDLYTEAQKQHRSFR